MNHSDFVSRFIEEMDKFADSPTRVKRNKILDLITQYGDKREREGRKKALIEARDSFDPQSTAWLIIAGILTLDSTKASFKAELTQLTLKGDKDV